MLEEIGEILLSGGGAGILALCAIVAVVFLWKALQAREIKHDKDRDQWARVVEKLASDFLESIKKSTANQERIGSSLTQIEKGQEKLLILFNGLKK